MGSTIGVSVRGEAVAPAFKGDVNLLASYFERKAHTR